MELGTKYLALTPSSPEERDEETKNDGDQSSGKSLYPVVHIAEMTNRTQPSTNAIKVNGRCVASLFDTGSCCTFVNKKVFPEETKLLNLRPYDGPDILSASGHQVDTLMYVEVYFTIGSIIMKHTVVMMEEIPHDCVIGLDWM